MVRSPDARRRGRPPSGPGGAKRSEMPRQIGARVPESTYRQLRALTAVLATSQADVLGRALQALQKTLPSDQQSVVKLLIRRGRR
jgi:hypothetical protein